MKIRFRALFASAAVAGVLLLPRAAEATTIIDWGGTEADFLSFIGGGLSVESFETPFAPAGSVAFSGFTMTETGGMNSIVSADSSFATSVGLSNAITDGSLMVSFADDDDSILTFQFGSPISAFGVYVTSTSGTGVITGTVVTDSGSFSQSGMLTANSPTFVWLYDDSTLFQTVSFEAAGRPNVGFDRALFGVPQAVVPEPASLTLLALGCAALGMRRRRPRKP